MSTEIIIALIGVLSTIVSSAATFIFTKRKYNAEVDASVIQNLKDSLDFYKEVSEDNRKKLDEYRLENESLRRQVNELQSQVLTLMGSICYDVTCQARKLKQEMSEKETSHENTPEKNSKKK